MAGPGKQRKLGPGGVCGSRARPGSHVGVACACARSPPRGTLAQPEPAAPAHLPRWPPRDIPSGSGLGAGGGGGGARAARAWGGGGGGAGRRPGRRRARVGGRGTSRLLWLSRYIRSRRPAALPTLPAPARAQQISTQRASRVAPRADGADMGRAMVARLGLGLLLLALLLPTQVRPSAWCGTGAAP